MVRDFYPQEQVNAARKRGVPRLREFQAECRRKAPLPTLDDLTTVDRCRYGLYVAKMQSFTPYSPWCDTCIGILHSDLVGLLAASVVFKEHLDYLVLLTADERAAWEQTGDHIIDGWYWCLWWKIHTTVPVRLRAALVLRFPPPNGFDYWIFTHGRGSTSFHELWRHDGSVATLVDDSFAVICAEHGPIDEWYE